MSSSNTHVPSPSLQAAAAVASTGKSAVKMVGAHGAKTPVMDAATQAAIAKGYVANRKLSGKVVGVWGEALIRTADGDIHPLKVGDVVKKGDVVLTAQDGIIQIEGARSAPAELERIITAVGEGRPEVAPAAGAQGDQYLPGLRVDRVVENVTPAGLELSPVARAVPEQFAEEKVVTPASAATPDLVTTDEDTGASFDPRLNDTSGSGAALTVLTVAGQPIAVGSPVAIPQGTITLNADGTLTFVPKSNFNGDFTINYTVTDGVGTPVSSSITISVTPVNDAPVAGTVDDGSGNVVDDPSFSYDPLTGNYEATTPEDTPVSGTIKATDVDGDTLTYTESTPPDHGTVVVNPDGTWTYTPSTDYSGKDSFTVVVDDGQGGTDIAVVVIDVTPVSPPPPVNEAPVASNDTVQVAEDTPATGNVLSNDTDPEGDQLTVVSFTVDANGDGKPDVFTPGTTTSLTDAAGKPIGDLVLNADGSYVFTPAPDYNGPVPVVTYTVSDGQGGTDTATLTIGDVSPVNDPPVANNDSVTVTEDKPATGNVLTNDTDVDGDKLTVAGYTIDANGDGKPDTFRPGETAEITDAAGKPIGELVINADGSYVFTPAPDYTGPVPVATYTVTDGQGGTDTATLTIGDVTPVNDPPVAADDAVQVTEDTPATGNVLGNDTDVDGDKLTVSGYTIDTNGDGKPETFAAGETAKITDADGQPIGELVIQPDGRFVFTPAPDYNGPVPEATYTVTDGHGGTDTATLTIGDVTPVNDPPVAQDDLMPVTEDTPATGNVLSNDSDVDGDELTVAGFEVDANGDGQPDVFGPGETAQITDADGQPIGELVINPDGSYVFTPAPDYNGPVPVVTYTVTDGQGGTDTATLTLGPVAGVNDAPVALDDARSTPEDTPVTIAVLKNDSDV
jgi:VCBS repeat-containing protein